MRIFKVIYHRLFDQKQVINKEIKDDQNELLRIGREQFKKLTKLGKVPVVFL